MFKEGECIPVTQIQRFGSKCFDGEQCVGDLTCRDDFCQCVEGQLPIGNQRKYCRDSEFIEA